MLSNTRRALDDPSLFAEEDAYTSIEDYGYDDSDDTSGIPHPSYTCIMKEPIVARTLNRLPFLGPIFALGWPLDDPGGPRNQLKKSLKQEAVPKWHQICANLADIECKRYT